jgi:hypothetical protein
MEVSNHLARRLFFLRKMLSPLSKFSTENPVSLGGGMKAAFVFLSRMMEKTVTNFLKTKAFLPYCYKQLRKEERLLSSRYHKTDETYLQET